MVIVGLILLFLILSLFTGHPISMIITGVIVIVGACVLAFAKSMREGFRMNLPDMNPGEKPRQYQERMYRLFDMKNPIAVKREQDFRKMNWQDFEHAVEKYFNRLGYATMHVGGTGDQGVDIEAYSAIDQSKAIIQCKHYNQNVGSVEVQKLAGAMTAHRADKAYLVTNAGFTTQAYEFAAMVPGLTLVTGKTLAETWEGVS
jgi:hypothetical protein